MRKKILKNKILKLALALAAVLAFGANALAAPASLHWPVIFNGPYPATTNYLNLLKVTAEECGDKDILYKTGYIGHNQMVSVMYRLEIPASALGEMEDGEYWLTPDITPSSGSKVVEGGGLANYYYPVRFHIRHDDGREAPIFLVAGPEGRKFTEEDREALKRLAEKYMMAIGEIKALQERINEQGGAKIGGYHPILANMLNDLRHWLAYFGVCTSGEYDDAEEYVTWMIWGNQFYKEPNRLAPEQIEAIMDTVVPFYLDYVEENRIEEPQLLGLKVGPATSRITGEKTLTLRLPADTDWVKAGKAVQYLTNKGTAVSKIKSALSTGRGVFVLSAGEITTGQVYDSAKNNGIVQTQWTVNVVEADPYNEITSFAVGGRQAGIDQEQHLISLNIAVEQGWEQKPEIEHTGTGIIFRDAAGNELPPDGSGAVDLSQAKTAVVVSDLSAITRTPRTIEQIYILNLTKGDSDECEIVSFSLGVEGEEIEWGSEGDYETIRVTIPYATQWSDLQEDVRYSYDATCEKSGGTFENSANQPLEYKVTSQSGRYSKTYKVTVVKKEPRAYCDILSFSIGSTTFVPNAGEIAGEISVGSLRGLKPEIVVSPGATISPKSGAAQDFTNPVTYTVTAEDGITSRTYTVRLSKAGAVPNEYEQEMNSLVSVIVLQFKNREAEGTVTSPMNANWERMNIGLWEVTARQTPPGLPENFNLALQARSSSVTDSERATIALTANGIDASNLGQYGDGSVQGDITTKICEYRAPTARVQGDQINGTVFALIALDMGNYSVPTNAGFKRAEALEGLLNCQWGDQSVDMTCMMMQCLAPYRDDPVFGERVRQKFEEFPNWLLTKMRSDFTFAYMGTPNCPTQAQVVCALCAAGIDPHADARFRSPDGKTSVLTALLDYSLGLGFKYTMSETAIEWSFSMPQGCYALQWYLGFLANGGEPYSLFAPPVYDAEGNYRQAGWVYDFSRPLSGEAELLKFTLAGKQAVPDSEGRIVIELPSGTALENLTFAVELSPGAICQPDPVTPVSFEEGVAKSFVVTAEDGQTKTYEVTVVRSGETPVTGVTLDRAAISLERGGTETLLATVVPADATNKNVTWTSDNGTVATVDAGGTVTGHDYGAAHITVTTADGGFSAACLVTVQAAPTQDNCDLNGDGRVNVLDMILIGQHFGETGAPGWLSEDINNDGRVDVLDMILAGQCFTS